MITDVQDTRSFIRVTMFDLQITLSNKHFLNDNFYQIRTKIEYHRAKVWCKQVRCLSWIALELHIFLAF